MKKRYIMLQIPETIDEISIRVILNDALTDYVSARTPVKDYVAKRYPEWKDEHVERKVVSTLIRIDAAREIIEGEKLIVEVIEN